MAKLHDIVYRARKEALEGRTSRKKAEKYRSSREEELATAKEILEGLTQEQLDIARDSSRMIAVKAPRRGGKTTAFIAKMLNTSLEEPGSRCYYGAITRARAKEIIWEELKQECEDRNIQHVVSEMELTIKLRNGSRISLVGLETISEVEKLRGISLRLFIADECGMLSPVVLKHLMEAVVQPALMDYGGQMVLGGTPGTIWSGPFFEASAPEEFRQVCEREGRDQKRFARPWADRDKEEWQGEPYSYSLHRWTLKEAPLDHVWDEALAIKELNGWSDDNPTWRREYLAEWVSSETDRVYEFAHGRNTWVPQLNGPKKTNRWGLEAELEPWHYLCGLDLGWDHPTAIIVMAFNNHNKVLYQVYEHKESGMSTDAIREKLFELDALFGGFEVIVGDPASNGKAIFASWAEHPDTPVHVIPAEKSQKRDYIEIFNSELHEGRIKALRDSEFQYEMLGLHWNKTAKEYERGAYAVGTHQPDHLCDAALYLVRHSHHLLAQPKAKEVEKGSVEYHAAEMQQMFDNAVRQKKKEEAEVMGWDATDGMVDMETEDWMEEAIQDVIYGDDYGF